MPPTNVQSANTLKGDENDDSDSDDDEWEDIEDFPVEWNDAWNRNQILRFLYVVIVPIKDKMVRFLNHLHLWEVED